MSIFTKRRKALRQKREADRKQQLENSKRFDDACFDVVETCKILQDHYPEFDTLDLEERLKLFKKTFDLIHNNG